MSGVLSQRQLSTLLFVSCPAFGTYLLPPFQVLFSGWQHGLQLPAHEEFSRTETTCDVCSCCCCVSFRPLARRGCSAVHGPHGGREGRR